MMKRFLVCVSLVALGACSADSGETMDLLRTGAGSGGVPASGGAGAPAASATAGLGGGVSGRSEAGAPSVPLGAAGQSGTGQSGSGPSGAAGMSPPAAGAQAVAGANAAGASAAGGGGAGMPANAGAGGSAGASGNTPGTVSVEFTTVSYDGEYAPLNYVAVWFETGGGEFVKTAARWAGAAHATDLVAWTEASGGWGNVFTGGGNMIDMTDAMSSATLRQHQARMVTWNVKDGEMQVVPDGDYVAVIEMTESRARDREGPIVRIPFTKGAAPQDVDMPDSESFTGIALHYAP